MERLTLMAAHLLRRHPCTVPYVIVCGLLVLLLALHPW